MLCTIPLTFRRKSEIANCHTHVFIQRVFARILNKIIDRRWNLSMNENAIDNSTIDSCAFRDKVSHGNSCAKCERMGRIAHGTFRPRLLEFNPHTHSAEHDFLLWFRWIFFVADDYYFWLVTLHNSQNGKKNDRLNAFHFMAFSHPFRPTNTTIYRRVSFTLATTLLLAIYFHSVNL